MAVFMVEFSYGLASPFMELSVGKPERKSEGSENMQRASKRALQRVVRASVILARHRPAEKLDLSMNKHMLYLKA